jgi:hypothetical protein
MAERLARAQAEVHELTRLLEERRDDVAMLARERAILEVP